MVDGRGQSGQRVRAFFDISNTRIETIVAQDQADAILAHVAAEAEKIHLVAFSQDVDARSAQTLRLMPTSAANPGSTRGPNDAANGSERRRVCRPSRDRTCLPCLNRGFHLLCFVARMKLPYLTMTAGVGCLAGLIACLTAPPPDVPQTSDVAPGIWRQSVVPPIDVPMADWPTEFIVPIQTGNSGRCQYDVFEDFDPATGSGLAYGPLSCAGLAEDGGVATLSVPLTRPESDVPCPMVVQFLVAEELDPVSARFENTPRG
jgi:hypothetical protein